MEVIAFAVLTGMPVCIDLVIGQNTLDKTKR